VLCLVVGNLTLDYVNGDVRIGGASFYGGWSLYLLGCETHVVTSLSSRYLDLIRDFAGKVRVHYQPCSGLTAFALKNGRAAGLLNPGCRIEWGFVEEVVEALSPDIVVYAPVYRELDTREFKSSRGKAGVVSLDLQGFTRRAVSGSIHNVWEESFESILEKVDLVHGNVREYCFADSLEAILLAVKSMCEKHGNSHQVSMDSNGLYLVTGSTVYFYPPHRLSVVDDVGAGDVLLVATSYYLARGLDVLDATRFGVAAALLKISSTGLQWFDENRVAEKARSVGYIRVSW